MKTLGQAGSNMPRVKAGDFDRAWQVIVAAGGDTKTKAYLDELVAAEKNSDTAREAALAAVAKAQQRETAAQKAEAAATVARQALADETARGEHLLQTREKTVAARETAAADVEKAQDARDKELAAREQHLAAAGVSGF